ncbi:MAG: cob(I)yrinic acid a,c-diamide adenosyltransferase [Lachnospiraceae bacterium]|nr:cob(I)yrinic acid a,c-diamide adenosyltransferase [Lachnospiraceae bacterium]
MEETGLIRIFAGTGKGKTSAAIGQGVKAATNGKTVSVIQFLKGKTDGEFDIIKRLEPEMKLFCFEKSYVCFDDLSESEKEEEKQNIRNGFNFAKKVLMTGECDLLILDEFLGLFDTGLLSTDDFKDLLSAKPKEIGIIMTGININEEICRMADEVTKLETVVFK